MNTTDILKGLRACTSVTCKECPFEGTSDNTSEEGKSCCDKLLIAAAELIEKMHPLVAPCEVGTVVYLIDPEELAADPQNCQIHEDEVYEVGRGITSDGTVKWLCLVKDTGLDFYDTNIGATAFFDYEAAQRRLKQEATT